MSTGQFIKVEITGFAECKTLNPLSLPKCCINVPHIDNCGLCPEWPLEEASKWEDSEKQRKEYVIQCVIVDEREVICDEGNPRDPDVFLECYPVGSIHTVEIVNETNVRINHEGDNSGK